MSSNLIDGTPYTATWMGRPLADLSKEELIEAVMRPGRGVERERASHESTLRMWELCRRAGK